MLTFITYSQNAQAMLDHLLDDDRRSPAVIAERAKAKPLISFPIVEEEAMRSPRARRYRDVEAMAMPTKLSTKEDDAIAATRLTPPAEAIDFAVKATMRALCAASYH